MGQVLRTSRLTLRPWRLEDAEAAFAVYGDPRVARWLTPAVDPVGDVATMRLLLQQWIAEDARSPAPAGRWAIELTAESRVVGGAAMLYLPPGDEDLEVGWQLAPDMWGHGLASEAGHELAHWALKQEGVEELFAVLRPANTRGAATAERVGMEWVGETDKYYGLRLLVYRLRLADLDKPYPGQPPSAHHRDDR
jgi:RimJ/RimL family protein N-acetyltransferase